MAIINGVVYDASGLPASSRKIRVYRRDTGDFLAQTLTSNGSPGDPDYPSDVLLIHCDGSENDTAFTDSSQYQRPIVAQGDAKVSLIGAKFDGSLSLDGNGDYLSVSPSADFAFATANFTVELFVKFSTLQDGKLITNRAPSALVAGTWGLNVSSTGLSFTEVTTGEPGVSATFTWTTNTWYHVAASRVGGTLYLFVDGVMVGSGAFSNNLNNTSYELVIGINPGENYIHGMMDEIRITKGVGRYSSNFSVPTVPFANNVNSLAVGHYDFNVAYTGEVNVLFLDDSTGDIYNDIVHRVLL